MRSLLIVALLGLNSAFAFSPSGTFGPRLASGRPAALGSRSHVATPINPPGGRLGLRNAASSTRMQVEPQVAQLVFGMVAGSVSSVMVLPADLVKTALQSKGVGEGTMTIERSDDKSMGAAVFDYLKVVVAEDGPGGLFKGFVPAIIGGAPEAGIQFMVHDWALTAMTAAWIAYYTTGLGGSVALGSPFMETMAVSLGPAGLDAASTAMIASAVSSGQDTAELLANAGLAVPGPPSFWISAMAGSAAGCGQVIVTNPMEVLKQREMLGQKKLSMLELGVGGLFKGAPATVLRDIPFSAIYFSAVSQLDALLYAQGLGPGPTTIIAGLLAGFLASFITTPADVIKTRIQTEGEGETIQSMTRKIVREDGLPGFFSGVVPRVSKIGPAMMINICVYESLKMLTAGIL